MLGYFCTEQPPLRAAFAVFALALLASCASARPNAPSCAFGNSAANGQLEEQRLAIGDREWDKAPMGPEDFAVIQLPDRIEPKDGKAGRQWRLFVSVTDRTDTESMGTIRTVIFDEKKGFLEETVKDLWPPKGSTDAFHPVGLSLTRHGDDFVLYAINTGSGAAGGLNRVEKFHLRSDHAKLEHLGFLESDNLPGPNDLLATKDGRIYVSNPRVPKFYKGSYFWDWPSLAEARVPPAADQMVADLPVRSTGHSFGFANGIVQPFDDMLLVADFWHDRIKLFKLLPESDSLDEIGEINFPGASPDNLMISEDGDKIYIATHLSQWATFFHLLFNKEKAPSAIYELDVSVVEGADDAKKIPEPKLILNDDGMYLKAASTATMLGDFLIVSQLKQPDIYAFRCVPQSNSVIADGDW